MQYFFNFANFVNSSIFSSGIQKLKGQCGRCATVHYFTASEIIKSRKFTWFYGDCVKMLGHVCGQVGREGQESTWEDRTA